MQNKSCTYNLRARCTERSYKLRLGKKIMNYRNLHLIFIVVLITVWQTNVNAQTLPYNIPDKASIDIALDSLILKEFYKNPSENLKVVFTLKIDSVGEVHSAHIRWNKNLKCEEFFTICNELESNFNLKFMYEMYKANFVGKKYVVCTYSYCNNRETD